MGKNKKKNTTKNNQNTSTNDVQLDNLPVTNPKYWIIDYIREKKNGIPIELEDILKKTLDNSIMNEAFISYEFIEHIKEYFIYQARMEMDDLDTKKNGEVKSQKEEVEELTKFLAPIVSHPYFNICFEAIMEYCIKEKVKIEDPQFFSQIFYNIMDLTEDREIKHKQWDYLYTTMIFKYNKKDFLLFSNKLMLQRINSIIGFNNIYMDKFKKENVLEENDYVEGIEMLNDCFQYLISKKILITPLVCTNERIRNLQSDDKSFTRFDMLDFFFLLSYTDIAVGIQILFDIILNKLDEAIEKENFYVIEQFFVQKVSWYNLNILIEFSELPIRAKFPDVHNIMSKDPFKHTFLDRIIELHKRNNDDFNNFEKDIIVMKNVINKINNQKYLRYASLSFRSRFLNEFTNTS